MLNDPIWSYSNILQKYVTPIGNNKFYDGTNIASITLSGLILGDFLTICGTVLFSDKNVGIQNITISGYLTSNNYILSTYYTNAVINPRILTPIFTVLPKTYDNISTNPQLIYTLSGFYPLDIGTVDLSSNYTGNYRQIYVGNNIPIDISNITLFGRDAFNYYLSTTLQQILQDTQFS
jgi:hypothetical protein